MACKYSTSWRPPRSEPNKNGREGEAKNGHALVCKKGAFGDHMLDGMTFDSQLHPRCPSLLLAAPKPRQHTYSTYPTALDVNLLGFDLESVGPEA